MRNKTTWLNLLFILLLAFTASGVVNAKVASGPQNLGGELHQSQSLFNLLLHQGKSESSYDDVSGSSVATKGAGSAARNPANATKLNKQLGSQQQLGEKGTTIAGPGAKRSFRDADRAARDHGGNPADFVKKRSSAHTASDGTKFRTHFIENTKTGQRFEHKTKLVD